MKKKYVKILAALLALVLLAGMLWFANGLLGNPISKALARHTAEAYLQETYPATDYQIEALNYSFKDAGYYAHIQSPSSEDSSFALCLDMLGNLKYDDYNLRVAGRENTARRIAMEYRALVDTVLESSAFPYRIDIAYGDLIFSRDLEAGSNQECPHAIRYDQLELDQCYDIPALGAKAGRLVLYLYADTADAETMASVLLDLRSHFTQAGVPFYSVDLELRTPKEGASPAACIAVRSFLSSCIVPEGLAEAVEVAVAQTDAYYAQQDAERQAEMESAAK